MKKLLDKILSPQLFAICYLPWLAINMVTVINVLDFTRFILIAFALWGVAICAKIYLFGGKTAWTDKGIALLIAFLAACLVSQVINFKHGGFDMIGKLCYFALCILILYSQHSKNAVDHLKTLSIVSRALGVAIGALMLVSDWMFITLFSATVVGRSGVEIKVGFAENRLFGIFSSPNVGGFYALILIWCSLIVLKLSKDMRFKALWRTLSVVQILAAVMYISVALSRGTYISGIMLVVAYLIIRPPFDKEAALNAFKQIGIRVLSIAAALIICVAGINAANWLSCEAMALTYRITTGEDKLPDIIKNAKLGADGRVEAGRDDIDITNKRSSIWSSNLSLLEGKHLVLGVNHPQQFMENSKAEGKTFTEDQEHFINYAGGNLHNGYLQILVNGGLLAFIPMLAFLILCVIKVIKQLAATLFAGKATTDDKSYLLFSLALPMVLAVLINNVFETNFVLMGANFIQAVFWFAAGICIHSTSAAKKEGAEK